MSRTSLELNWLLRKDKQTPLPLLVFGNLNGPQGSYYEPWWDEVVIDGKCYGSDRGIIAVDPVQSDQIDSCLAHEWRHHWQRMNGWKIQRVPHNFENLNSDGYWRTIRSYFRSQAHEADALRFELKVAPGELAKQFYDVSK